MFPKTSKTALFSTVRGPSGGTFFYHLAVNRSAGKTQWDRRSSVISAWQTQLMSVHIWFLSAFVATTRTSRQGVPLSTPTKVVPHLTRNAVWECAVITCYVPIITSVDRSIWESSYYEHKWQLKPWTREDVILKRAIIRTLWFFISLRCSGQLLSF